jgi:hypothetical protein
MMAMRSSAAAINRFHATIPRCCLPPSSICVGGTNYGNDNDDRRIGRGIVGSSGGGVVVVADRRRSISSSGLVVSSHPDAAKSNRPPPKETLKFGHAFSPHMLTVVYDKKLGGWQAPEIVPYGDLSLSPAASSLHYGMQCFEGMKAYRALKGGGGGENGGVVEDDFRLFRPDRNMKRLKDSMKRLGMPGYDFDGGEAIECIKELVRLGESYPFRDI